MQGMFGPGGFFGVGDAGHHGFFGGAMPGRFDHEYQAFPVSFIGKEDLENGNKLILPQSALDHLARLNISYPMLFEISNGSTSRRTHSGVQEFIADEGTCYLPYWMMQNLLLREGDMLRVTNISLPKGTFVKLQPHSSDFLDINNPKAVLETSLRNFATLTVGDVVVINYNQKKYYIEIIECKPAAAVSIIEADVNVDFAPPKDYREPAPATNASSAVFQGTEEAEEEEAAPAPKKDLCFSGAGQRIDGKPIKAPSISPAVSKPEIVDPFENLPWKKRIPGGVKWTEPPHNYTANPHRKA
mmetsp:Transcript_25722/g.46998  ORF Transcript_25722/g.46998 Transcript_25722/m.46998 type:complete len:300 (-) Transcript_25722:112-1011(-)